MPAAHEKIEILSIDFFQTHHREMEIVESVREILNDQAIGWHYFLDLAWILREIRGLPKGSVVLDAGAGTGLAQFVLIEMGYNVISVDFSSDELWPAQTERYGAAIIALNSQARRFSHPYLEGKRGRRRVNFRVLSQISKEILKETPIMRRATRKRTIMRIRENSFRPENQDCPTDNPPERICRNDSVDHCGRLFMYNADIRDMYLLPDNFVDAVISVSALEHNSHDDFELCLKELLRVTKPGGPLLITISAADSEDWYHEPSKGWCYSEETIRKLFGFSDSVPSNYQQSDELLEKLKEENNELHKRLAPFYYQGDKNGMPWGNWNPEYQPVGVLKIKPENRSSG